MSLVNVKRQILAVLVENLDNAHPQIVEAGEIARRLSLPLAETCQCIRILNSAGVVESDPEGTRALITCEGLRYMSQQRIAKAA